MNLKKAAQKKLRKSGGFTLVEMLIVVAIIAILVVVSIPMVSSSLDKARTATDDANVRAAKAAALIEYMITEPVPETATYYYDAVNGTVQETTVATGYNQAQKGENTPENAIIKIVIEDNGKTVTPTWIKQGTT